ncbi:MAG TPA: transcriptional repressor [Acidimicrobiales bacterium]|nr:transcriptional repressor [Acidimicrobiales bacterium]
MRPNSAEALPTSAPRSTRQKRAVAQLLGELDVFRSAQDLYAELRRRGERVGLTTVYNQLRTMSESGEVDVIRTEDGESLYRLCGSGHHHHVVCRSCGLTIEVEGPELESLAARLASKYHFSEVTHTFEIAGLCSTCACV